MLNFKISVISSMKAVKIFLRPCHELNGKAYLGFRTGHYFEHLVYDGGRVRKVRACQDCPISRFVQASHVISPPRTVGGLIRLVVTFNNAVARLISYYGPRVVKAEYVDIRGAIVTEHQKNVLSMVNEIGVSEAARRLGRSKTAIRKLVKSALRKLVEIYA